MQQLLSLITSKRYRTWAIVATAVIFVVLMWIWVTNTPSSSAQNDVPGSDVVASVGMFVDVTLKLGAVLLLIFISVSVMRWFQNRTVGSSIKQMNVIESVRLSSRQAVHIIRIGSRDILIGATDQSITYLGDVDAPSDDSVSTGLSRDTQQPQNSFGSLLETLFVKDTSDRDNQ